MIIIKLLGVDQFQAQSFVSDIQEEVAQAFETEPDQILFYAPDSFLIYRGVDQTSFYLDVEVELPESYHPLENQIADVLHKIFSKNHVHVRVLFSYFEKEHEHEFIDESYPRFMTEENSAHFEADEEEEEDGVSEEEIYTGNAFADYDERVKEKEKEQLEEEAKRQAARTDNKRGA